MQTKKRKQHAGSTAWDMSFITSGISTTLVLLLLGLVTFFVLTARNLSVYVKENINVSVIVADDMKEADILKLQQQLAQAPFARHTEYISKEQALREQIAAMGTDPQEFLGYNPLRASIEVKLRARYANADSIARIGRLIKQQNGQVQEVRYQEELTDLVNRNISNISLLLLAMALLLALISFALINNTIRLTIYSKRFLIHTMTLVGASWRFIRRPFLWRSFRLGVTAGIIADVLLGVATWSLLRYEPELTRIVTPGVMLTVWFSVLLFGIGITWLCARLSINKFLRMKEGRLYYI
ncbi:MAG: permease-like cell division protein FtsX [Prevotellaceae bacterium]|jgi:cell division transport system permease protein|nr:permease-like cell division protein FtsX [Prevotellaceae bacterium]